MAGRVSRTPCASLRGPVRSPCVSPLLPLLFATLQPSTPPFATLRDQVSALCAMPSPPLPFANLQPSPSSHAVSALSAMPSPLLLFAKLPSSSPFPTPCDSDQVPASHITPSHVTPSPPLPFAVLQSSPSACASSHNQVSTPRLSTLQIPRSLHLRSCDVTTEQR